MNLQWLPVACHIQCTFFSLVFKRYTVYPNPQTHPSSQHRASGMSLSSPGAFTYVPFPFCCWLLNLSDFIKCLLESSNCKLVLNRSPPNKNLLQERKKWPRFPYPKTNSVNILIDILPVFFPLKSKQGFRGWTTNGLVSCLWRLFVIFHYGPDVVRNTLSLKPFTLPWAKFLTVDSLGLEATWWWGWWWGTTVRSKSFCEPMEHGEWEHDHPHLFLWELTCLTGIRVLLLPYLLMFQPNTKLLRLLGGSLKAMC